MSAGTMMAITLGAAQGADRVHSVNARRQNNNLTPVGVILTGDWRGPFAAAARDAPLWWSAAAIPWTP